MFCACMLSLSGMSFPPKYQLCQSVKKIAAKPRQSAARRLICHCQSAASPTPAEQHGGPRREVRSHDHGKRHRERAPERGRGACVETSGASREQQQACEKQRCGEWIGKAARGPDRVMNVARAEQRAGRRRDKAECEDERPGVAQKAAARREDNQRRDQHHAQVPKEAVAEDEIFDRAEIAEARREEEHRLDAAQRAHDVALDEVFQHPPCEPGEDQSVVAAIERPVVADEGRVDDDDGEQCGASSAAAGAVRARDASAPAAAECR